MFMDSDNSVVQTTFEEPCAAKAGGFTAGPMENRDGKVPGPTKDLKISSNEPLWMTSKAAAACGRGMVFSVNAAPGSIGNSHSAFQQAAIRKEGKDLKLNAIVAAQPVPQVASTVTLRPGNVAAGTAPSPVAGAPGAAQPSVVAGQGTTGNGQPCGCSCLCGSGAAPPQGVGQGSFGGVIGKLFCRFQSVIHCRD